VAIKQIIDIMANETEAAKDKAVSKAFGVSERTARRWRLRLED
jgi:transposase